MTEEQAVKILKQGSKMAWDAEEFCEAYDMAIKALEQQPCDDCVSRKSLLDKLDPLYEEKIKTAPDNMAEGFMQVSNLIKHEPPVTPTFPKGVTNGNMIKAMFDIKDNQIVIDGNVIHVYANGWWLHLNYKEWWNAPYKRGNEE